MEADRSTLYLVATAHLDSESEVAVQAALTEALAGRTAIVSPRNAGPEIRPA